MLRNYLDSYTSINFNVCCCNFSFALLYSVDEIIDPEMTIKAVVISGIGVMSILIIVLKTVNSILILI